MIRLVAISICILALSLIRQSAYGAPTTPTSTSFTYQGRILKANGKPLEYNSVSFLFRIMDTTGQCVIYQEQYDGVDMTNSNGVFDIPIGMASIQYIAAGSHVTDVFNNFGASYACGVCNLDSGNTYSCSPSTSSPYAPRASDGRLLRVSFYDGSGWKTIAPDNEIRAVPYAGYAVSAQKLGENFATDFILKSEVNNDTSCSSGSFLTWNATTRKFGCSPVAGAKGGTVTSITAGDGLTGGTIIDSGTISLDTTGVTLGTYGSSSQVPILKIDSFGRIISASNSQISGVSPGGAASGDLSGNYPSPTVSGIGGTPLAITSLADGHFLKYNNGTWINALIQQSEVQGLATTLNGYVPYTKIPTCNSAGTTLTFISATGFFDCTPIAITGSKVTGDITGKAAGFSGLLAGDVVGTQSSTTVNALQGKAVSELTPTSNQVLQWDDTNKKWTPATISTTPSGNAGGDLAGFYPNPTLITVGTAGTYYSVTTDSNGRVISGSNSLSATDISGNIPWSKISSTPTTLSGYGITDAIVKKAGDSMSGNLTHATNTGNIYTASGGGTAGIQGPNSAVTTNYVLRLPSSTPSISGQALVSDLTGNLSWQTLSTGTVTSVSATSPLSSTGGASPSISLAGLSGLGSANQILGMNNGGSGYEYKTVSGTANRISIVHGTNSITFSTPQDIATNSNPTFASMTLSGMNVAGIVKNNASGVLSGGNSINISSSEVSGVLPIARGGTNTSSFSPQGVIVSNSTGTSLTAVTTSTSGTILQYGASGPVFSTIAYPLTIPANQLLYSSSANVISGMTTPANSVLTSTSAGVPKFEATSNDIFSQYALLLGRAGGQALSGGSNAGEQLTLRGTSSVGGGNIVLNPSGGEVGIGTTDPQSKLHVAGDIQIGNSSAACSTTVEGAQRYNSTLKRMEYCDGVAWQGLGIPAGAIQAFAQSSCPTGWLYANGSAVSRITYSALFSAVSTSYGVGNGSTTFALPDYRGYFLRGWSNGSGVDSDASSRTNRGDGTTGDAVGTKQLDQFKSHNHGISDPGHSHAQATTNGTPQTPGREVPGSSAYGYDYADGAGAIPTANSYTGISVAASGGTETRPKNINVLYCIKY